MMVNKKKTQSRSQSSTEKTPNKTLDLKLLSKLANGKDSKHMLRGMSSKTEQGLSSSQSRVVRCPKCQKFLQEPIDVTIYKCSGCNSILQAKRWDNNDKDLLSSQNRSLSSKVESAEGGGGSKTPVRSIYRKFSSRASPCFDERGYHSETAYRRHETSYIPREWRRRRADEFSVTSDFASARSCSSVVKLSIAKKEDTTTTLLDLLRFSNYGRSLAEESVAIHEDSASDSHLSSSDKGSGDRICISTDDVTLKKRNQEMFEHKKDIRSKFYDLKLEAFQPCLNHKLREQHQQQPVSRIHREQYDEESSEGGGSITPVRSSYRKYSSRASPLFETGYMRRHETSATPSPSSYGYTSPFHRSASEQSYHHQQPNQFKGWFQESSSAAASPISYQGETSDQKCYHWSSQQSQMLHDSQNLDESSSWSGVLNLSSFKKKEEEEEDNVVIRRSASSEFYELKPEAFQPEAIGETSSRIPHSVEEALNKKKLVWETNLLSEKNTRDRQEFDLGEFKWEDFMGDKGNSICDSSSNNGKMSVEDTKHISNQSGKATVTASKIHDEYENISDRVRYELEDERLETAYASERRWAEATEDRAGLHLEEYETNYENYRNPFEWSSEGAAPTFHRDEYEVGTVVKFRRPESSSRGSFSDHEGSEESEVICEFQEAKPHQFQYEISSELSNTVVDIVRSELQEAIETFEQGKMVGVGSVGKASETIIGGKTELTSHQMAPQSENVEPDHLERRGYASERTWTETMGDGSGLHLEEHQNNSHGWTSQRASTFPLHEHELGTMSVSERSIFSSKNVFDDHESSKERALAHEEEPWLVVDENKTEELKIGVMVEETFGLTESTNPMFCLHEHELGITLLEPDNEEESDGSSESSSSTGSFNSHEESSKLRAVFLHQEEEPQVMMSDSRTEMISVKLEDIFEWTSERAPTFRLYDEPELGALVEPDEDAYGRLESSSSNNHVIPKEREMMEDHGDDSKLVTDEDELCLVYAYETKALKVDVMAEDGPSQDLDQSREDIFRLSLDDTTVEQEWVKFDSETSPDRQVNLRQTFKQGDTEGNIQVSGSMVSSGHEPPSITAQVENEAEEEILRDHFKHLQNKNESSTLTSEIVGLRHALYQTQITSPLSSSPIHTPIGSSPLHIRMRSSMNSHIVSPLRSPTKLSGSLSDVLFLAKKT